MTTQHTRYMQLSITAEQGSILPGHALLTVFKSVEFLFVLERSARGMRCYVSVDYDDEKSLEVGDTTMEILNIIKKSETHAVCEVLLTGTLAKYFAQLEDVWWVSPSHTHPNGMILTLRGTVDSLMQVRETMGNLFLGGYKLRVSRASEDQPELSTMLTERQTVVLNQAISSGYYRRPRECTQRDIAKSLDLKQATVSQHLQSAEAIIINRFATGS